MRNTGSIYFRPMSEPAAMPSAPRPIDAPGVMHALRRFARAERLGQTPVVPPVTTALGALLNHVTRGHVEGGKGSFQPMNVNFGLFPELDADPGGKGKERGRIRKKALADRALADLGPWLEHENVDHDAL